MNKTLTVNIGGYVFTIEEEAYLMLNNYLQNIRMHFTNTRGQDEIMADIESRIAEMLREKTGGSAGIVTAADINIIMDQMGKPEDFAGEETSGGSGSESHGTAYIKKRVYRDSDDKIIGGVCSGIGHYFGIDPLWLRLGFGASFLFFGSGLLFYILLWVAIPEARSASEKLEMRGKKVDINAIGKQVSEEFDRIKNNIKSEAGEVKNNIKPKAENALHRVSDFIGDVGMNLIKSLSKIIAYGFVFIGMFVLIALLSSIFGASHIIHFNIDDENLSYSVRDLINVIFSDSNQVTLATIGLFLLIGVPLLMVVYKGLRMLLKIKKRNPLFSMIATFLFLAGTAMIVYVLFLLNADFAKRGKITERKSFLPGGNTLVIRSDAANDTFYADKDEDETELVFTRNIFLHIDKNTIALGNIQLDILPSPNDSFALEVMRTARAKNSKEAYSRARNLNYSYTIKDSTLLLPRYFTSSNFNKFRGQKIKMHLYVPYGKTVVLNNSVGALLYDVKNTSNTLDRDMTGKSWTMKKEGLTCSECPESSSGFHQLPDTGKHVSEDDEY
jgi:phage shock protein PspC (stress-responsive transcriptional regulator)